MIKYIEIKLEKYVEVQEYYINDNSYEWWNGGTEIYESPVYSGDFVYLVVDTSSRAIGEVKKSDLPNDVVIEEFVKVEEKKQQSALGAYIVTPSGISIFFAGKSYIVAKDHINYNSIYKAVQIGDYSSIDDLVNISVSVQNFGNGNLIVKDGIVYYNNEQLHGAIVSTVLKLIRDGFSIEPLEKFLSNLDLNPSKRAVTELYGFLEIGNLPITNDGCFLAYKKVRQNFKDIFTGTMDNSVGAVCSMPRNKVDDDSNRTCSTGLHVCSYDYLQHFGNSTSDTVVICKINPKDVVSIPTDYNFTKMRVCEYTVIGEDTEYRNKNKLFGMSVYNEYDDDEYDDDEYDDDEYDDDEYDDDEYDDDDEEYFIDGNNNNNIS